MARRLPATSPLPGGFFFFLQLRAAPSKRLGSSWKERLKYCAHIFSFSHFIFSGENLTRCFIVFYDSAGRCAASTLSQGSREWTTHLARQHRNVPFRFWKGWPNDAKLL